MVQTFCKRGAGTLVLLLTHSVSAIAYLALDQDYCTAGTILERGSWG
jgi:hypothetical protein